MERRKPAAAMTSLQRRFYQRTLGLLIVCGVITLLVIYYGPRLKSQRLVGVDRLTLDIGSGHFTLQKLPSVHHIEESLVLEGLMGGQQWGPGSEGGWSRPWSDCVEVEQKPEKQSGRLQVSCEGRARLTITHRQEHWTTPGDHHRVTTHCHQVQWRSLSPGFIPTDCFSVPEGHHWFGGAEVLNDRWTLEKGMMSMQHFLSNDVGLVRDGYGGVMERYWLTSTGVSIMVDDHVPLHVGITRKEVCLKADYANSWYQNPTHSLPTLNYTICSSHNLLQAHLRVVNHFFQPSRITPHESLFTKPIWSTWAKFRTTVNQTNTLQYAALIRQRGFEGCQIEIDDGYTKHYGDWVFEQAKFPDPLAMSKELEKMGFKVTTWITPFTNNDSSHYDQALSKGFFIKSSAEPSPNQHLVKWWRGEAGVVDLTNPAAVQWMKERLDSLKSQGVSAFKFDAGESNLIPKNYSTYKPLVNLNHYGRLYASLMYNLTGNTMIEVRVGYRSQHLPVMVRMMDKDSSWGYHRGIQTLIPTALLFGILGYPYVLPDMVGGNGYAGEVKHLPDKELYLRWLAATILLPFVQFSIPPWDYDSDTVRMAQDLLKIRQTYMKDIQAAAAHSAASANPMIKPLWWLDPDNPHTYEIDSEFILGADILVAPILHQGWKKRDIYLPRGSWRDERTGNRYTGSRTIYNYPVALNQLPVFRLDSTKPGQS